MRFPQLDRRSEQFCRVHNRAAQRILRLCKSHGGIYTKLGQYLSTLTHILPEEYTSTLSVLTDNAQSVPWDEIKHIIQEDFGAKAEAVFEEVDQVPIAAASLAQVHRGVRKDGVEVAIKLQYPHLAAQTSGDVVTFRLIVKALRFCFPKFDLSWILPEFEQNLCHEMDFRQGEHQIYHGYGSRYFANAEALNATRVARLFDNTPSIKIPKIDWALTSDRCLTMEYIHGIKVTDKVELQDQGIAEEKVAALVCEAFSQMIFSFGFVHCDPHAGNLLIQKKNGKPVLVILDHGMYRKLDERVRYGYALLWCSMALQDKKLGSQACRIMGVGDQILPTLSFLLTLRTYNMTRTSFGSSKLNAEDRAVARKQFENFKLEDINSFLFELPRDVIWVFRASNIVRSLNASLGGSTADRLRIMSVSALRSALDTAFEARITAAATEKGKRISLPGGEKAGSNVPLSILHQIQSLEQCEAQILRKLDELRPLRLTEELPGKVNRRKLKSPLGPLGRQKMKEVILKTLPSALSSGLTERDDVSTYPPLDLLSNVSGEFDLSKRRTTMDENYVAKSHVGGTRMDTMNNHSCCREESESRLPTWDMLSGAALINHPVALEWVQFRKSNGCRRSWFRSVFLSLARWLHVASLWYRLTIFRSKLWLFHQLLSLRLAFETHVATMPKTSLHNI